MIVLDAILDLMSEGRAAAMLVGGALGGLGLGFWLGRRGWGLALAGLAMMLALAGLSFWAASRGSGEWGRQLGFVLLALLGPLPALLGLAIGGAAGVWRRRRHDG
ncbi:hypothetical protein [Rubellimicrobium roseum]|uniref:Uncharacterized protein n=1 Tax=Rubellimicrobium roseum TaxID=687525 RepID=A0A5C4NG66_9RHOB|nr:hypothetical protein [Rubellimicrobium roseum]TNC73814.1 hypothetical protein FHG71_04900 [Rubellimicrobium roseum]